MVKECPAASSVRRQLSSMSGTQSIRVPSTSKMTADGLACFNLINVRASMKPERSDARIVPGAPVTMYAQLPS